MPSRRDLGRAGQYFENSQGQGAAFDGTPNSMGMAMSGAPVTNAVSAVVVISAGAGCVDDTYYVDGTTRAGVAMPSVAAQFRIEVTSGAVSAVYTENSGSGYSEPPTVELPASTCTAAPVMEAVLNALAGGVSTTIVTAQGTQAKEVAVFGATRKGTGYTTEPSLVLVGGEGHEDFQAAAPTPPPHLHTSYTPPPHPRLSPHAPLLRPGGRAQRAAARRRRPRRRAGRRLRSPLRRGVQV
jgi:hypothetical protein